LQILSLQLVAMNLKEQGSFVCRGLSFKQCSYRVVTFPLDGTEAGNNYNKVRVVVLVCV
jgi:hypothetical protein